MQLKIVSDFKPTGDQPEAIRQLTEGVNNNERYQTLLGVTGSGKTFTVANVIEQTQKPTLILSHNKTLAAQLYGEFKQFFPENAVEYFVSYYDYYQPEAFIPTTNTYIEKDLAINDEIEKLRLSTTSSLLSGRRDVIVVSSVSCIYGLGNPDDFLSGIVRVSRGQKIARNALLHQFVTSLYSRSEIEFKRGTFRVKGDTVDIYLAYAESAYRFTFYGDEIEEIESIDPVSGKRMETHEHVSVFPANIFVTNPQSQLKAIWKIQEDMVKQSEYFKEIGKPLEAKRLEDRTTYDLEMIRELGYCSGIENYSRYFDGREPGQRPFCLLDYFPDDFLMVIDESHVTVPQLRAMYGGDRSRKINLVEYGFRLPAAMDNRPLKFEEFETMQKQVIYVSATPADYEIEKSEGVIVEQVIRPTGLLDPPIEVRPCINQVDDLLEEIANTVKNSERVLVTTLTKRMAEELAKYLTKLSIKCRYIHSEVETLDRVEILRDFRLGVFDVLIGINLLREGLDLPEVSLVAILDADKEGFLRSNRSLTQTAGRAARNVNGRVIFYADKVTESMRKTMEETERRREKQLKYNEANNITPQQIVRSKEKIMGQTIVSKARSDKYAAYSEPETTTIAADPVVSYMSKDQLQKTINNTRKKMETAAKDLDFIEAARLRDEMFALEKLIKEKK
ncbi:MAG TPA: excinuclease ABC subunit UvrB [Bacteroidia bacterium]|nr:excinuclease ABC subunit UvrB [Bacteroidia bacterium]HNU34093.1 excinuclease ABC subunit UvrB [Bacteroidia bacterium]